MTTTDTDLARESDVAVVRSYQAARDEVDRLNQQLGEATKALAKAEQRVLDLYTNEGIQSVRVDGRLVSLTRTLWASPKAGSEDALVGALIADGHEELVRTRVMSQTLSAWVRERDREEEVIPDAILQHLNVAEKFGLSMRKG